MSLVDNFCKKCNNLKIQKGECKFCRRNYMKEYQHKRRLNPDIRKKDNEIKNKYDNEHREEVNLKAKNSAANKRKWLNELKSHPCVDCNESFPECCMDFDHINGIKSGGIGIIASRSKENILKEIEKCELVCACCHRIRTYNRNPIKNTNSNKFEIYQKVVELKQNPCLDCCEMFDSVAMDFDHVKSDKKFTISQMSSPSKKHRNFTWDEIEAEINKCELVCANCHRIRTWKRKNNTENT